MARKLPATTVTHHAWLEQARQLADAGDRWLVSLGRSVERLGTWVGQPAGTDAATDRAPRGRSTQRCHRRSHSDRRPSPSTCTKTSRTNLGLISALPATLSKSPGPDDELPPASDAADHPAGVLPLVQALGRVVADHQDGGYASLVKDERLWTLLDLLYVLSQRTPPAGDAVNQAPPREY